MVATVLAAATPVTAAVAATLSATVPVALAALVRTMAVAPAEVVVAMVVVAVVATPTAVAVAAALVLRDPPIVLRLMGEAIATAQTALSLSLTDDPMDSEAVNESTIDGVLLFG
jgi:hypothetical protein